LKKSDLNNTDVVAPSSSSKQLDTSLLCLISEIINLHSLYIIGLLAVKCKCLLSHMLAHIYLEFSPLCSGGSSDIKKFSDIEKFRLACGASSVMVARAAEWNLSVFRKEGPLDKLELIKEYIKLVSRELVE